METEQREKNWKQPGLIPWGCELKGKYVKAQIYIRDEIAVRLAFNKRGYCSDLYWNKYTDIHEATKEAERLFDYCEKHLAIRKAFKKYTKSMDFFEYGISQSMADADKDTNTTIYDGIPTVVTDEVLDEIQKFKDMCPEVMDVKITDNRHRDNEGEFSILEIVLILRDD